MRLLQEHHAEPALPYAATDAQWEFPLEQLPVEEQLALVL